MVVENQSLVCLFTAKGRCLHLGVSEGQVVVEGVKVHQKAMEVVTEGTQHAAVTGLFACFEKEVSETLQNIFVRDTCENHNNG